MGRGPRPEGNAEVADEPAADAVLVRRAVLGDRSAFTTIFHRHGPAMFRYALNMLEGNTQDAEDALQATWTKVWVNIETFHGRSALRTWLFTVTANEVLNQRRRRRPVPVDDTLLIPRPEKAHLAPAAQLDQRQLQEALSAALTELPWRQRASWILREMEGQSYEDIAQILDTTPTVIRGQLHRARTTLATRMETWR
ncbi:RNA polymerase sigma factor [Kineosporia mesophila]|uniref:RNA polymerase sigma factor n=1 Tax=Kineosporia mesophila TaxID=566012 RepID=UPI001E2C1DE8|nr:RNA polymerase sigma factor [Kineosporia mesophila]